MEFYWLILGILAVWRVTHLLQAEDGPLDIVVHLRRAAGNGLWGKLLDCFNCLSLWIAAPVAYLTGRGWAGRIFLWLGLSGGSILLEQIFQANVNSRPAPYHEDEEEQHVMLRRTKEADSNDRAQPPTLEHPNG